VVQKWVRPIKTASMTSYNTSHDDYSLMNYVLAGISALTIALPVATWFTKGPVSIAPHHSISPSNSEAEEKHKNSETDL